MMSAPENSAKANAIALAAIDAIHEFGLSQVKLTDIARKAGVTTGAVTYYFADKDAVLVAAFEEVGRQLFSEAKTDNRGWTIERALSYLPTTPNNRKHWNVWLAYCGRALSSPKMNAIYRRFYAELEKTVAQQVPHVDRERANEIAGSVIAAIDGVGLCATLQPDAWPAARQENRLRELLVPFFTQ